MDELQFKKLFAYLVSLYPSSSPHEGSASAYWRFLGDLPTDALRAAVRQAVRDSPEFIPSAAKIRQYAMEGGVGRRAMEAWPEVLRLASRSSSEHSDPVAAETIRRMGGGRRLGQMTENELHVWAQKRFLAVYAELSKGGETPLRISGAAPEVRNLVAGIVEGK